MSIRAVSQALEAAVTPTQKLVLLIIAERANEAGEAWPSVSKICKTSGLSDRAVQLAIQGLERAGWLEVERRTDRKKRQTSSMYRFRVGERRSETEAGSDSELASDPEGDSPPSEAGSPLPPNDVHRDPERRSPSYLEPLTEPSFEPSKEPLPPSLSAGEPAQKSLALQATGPLEVLRDAWPEFRRRCFRALGIDEHEERKLEASLLLLPGQGHQLLISNWSVLGRGRPGADLLVVADWIVAGALGGQRFKPFWLAKKLDDCLKASAAWDAAGRPSISALMPLPAKPEPLTAATWKAYSEAYEARYRVPPVRNAAVNGQIAQLVKQLGAEEAPQVAAYYLTHNDAFYQAKHHDVGLLVKDCRSLRTQWARGQQMTVTQARRIEQTTANPALEILQDRARQRRGGDV